MGQHTFNIATYPNMVYFVSSHKYFIHFNIHILRLLTYIYITNITYPNIHTLYSLIYIYVLFSLTYIYYIACNTYVLYSLSIYDVYVILSS